MENKNINSKKSRKHNIIKQMFDVRPVDEAGDLDLEKIGLVGSIASPLLKRQIKKKIEPKKDAITYQLGQGMRLEDVPIFYDGELIAKSFYEKKKREEKEMARIAKEKKELEFKELQELEKIRLSAEIQKETEEKHRRLEKRRRLAERRKLERRLFSTEIFENFNFKKYILAFTGVMAVALFVFFGTSLYKKGMAIKGSAMNSGKSAYVNLAQAKDNILNNDFKSSQLNFEQAYANFDSISRDLDDMGGAFIGVARFVPYLSKLSSGAALAQAGKDVSQTGSYVNEVIKTMDSLKNQSAGDGVDGLKSISMLKIFQETNANVEKIQALLKDAEENIDKVNVDDVPDDQRVKFVEMKNKLPEINKFLAMFVDNSKIFTDVLGGNGPRKYLFLFQNNQEMRATGGFIGTYGVMNILNGRIDKFFIDGIFNPDGQLREKVVPPKPIQKISAAWSLHDSNWFPDFPASAEKATWFYEKTGGPTVDGVITMTPTVMQKLLRITGPIEMAEYGVTVDENNFLEEIQREVEVDYDKDLNQPKKILADLAPIILDKIFNTKSTSDIVKTAGVLLESLNEKQILIYSKNYDIEKKLSELHWSGEVLATQKDYVSVVNTNINGYKTDGVVDEKIGHEAEIQADGTIVDTLTITRHHNGGNTNLDWLNRVNADYMRVYVPKGSKLLSVEGQTREFNSAPLDYEALGFKHDAQIKMEEDSMEVDESSGARIYDDFDKTVFANWVYVSPQETVVVKYKYVLPFKINLSTENKLIDTYSLLAQKQSGSIGSQFESVIIFPKEYAVNWKYPDDITQNGNVLLLKSDLRTDKFIGVAFMSSQNKE
jgi:hypothetical protein